MPKHKSGYLLPPENEIETPDRICVQFQMPNTEEYRIAVMGQIFELCKWWAWDKTEKGDTRASRASHMFRDTTLETFQFLDSCLQAGTNVIFRQTECTLEASTDNGETWIVIFDAEPCKPVITYVDGSIQVDGNTIVTNETFITDSIIQPDTDHIKGDGLDKRCNMASYLVDIPLPDLVNKTITEYQNAQNSDAFLLAMLGIGALIVTGGIAGGFIGAYSGGLALGGIATAGAYKTIESVMSAVDITALQAELTNTFWQQDLKCVIYCHLASNVILDDGQMIKIADAIDAELSATYPNASQLLSAIFRTMSIESRGAYQKFGSVYDGSGCDLCSCNFWTHHLHKEYNDNYWYAEKYTTLVDNTEHWPRGAEGGFIDGTPTLNDDKVEVILDLSKTTAFLTSVFTTGVAYRTSSDGDSGTKYMYLYAWDEINKDWLQIGSTTMSTIGGQRSINLDPLPFPTTKLKLQVNGWGEKSPDSWWSRTQIVRFLAYGYGDNVLLDEYNEWKANL